MNKLASIPQIKNLNEEERSPLLTSLYDPEGIFEGRYKEFIMSHFDDSFSSTTEEHHVIPRCCQGTDRDNNLIIPLSLRDHFLAHKILAEDHPDSLGLMYAYWRLCNGRYQCTPEEYEEAKMKFYALHRGENHPFYGRHHTDKSKRKISEANRGRVHVSESKSRISDSLKGRILKDSHKQHIADSCKGKEIPDSVREKISETLKGRVFSEESKKKMSERCANRVYHIICHTCGEEFLGRSSKTKYCDDCRRKF